MRTSRRDFMRSAALAGAAFAFPGAGWLDAAGQPGPAEPFRPLPPDAVDDEVYWRRVRDQFLLSPGGIYLNTGTVGASPRMVLDAVVNHMTALETVFDARGVDLEALRRSVGTLLGAPAATLAFTRNTTESMSWIAGGLDLQPGDEVLMTTHEHVGGMCPWQAAARRRHLVLTQIPLPVPPTSSREIVDTWRRAIGERTRVMMISHVLFTNGLIQPVKELCALARERGIVTAIDGAHPPGMLRFGLTDLGCDFYASSPHKWLLAPKGSGLLYVSEAWVDRLWPTIVSGGWDALQDKAVRFDRKGTVNESLLAGFQAAVDFHTLIGPERVERRIRWLGDRLYDGLARLPGVELKSATDAGLRAPMVSFTVRGLSADDLIRALWERGTVRVRHVAEYDYHWVRLSTHVYNTPDEVDRVVALVGELAGGRS
ncbi:MAG TPA: aminotransferase class V-fold PLP-dependent enzyme [Gemmatimonadales bacterium]|nr:aminotransferase class V-fold PLP-dependent enzyme [Gemmatimonadales bacterium]